MSPEYSVTYLSISSNTTMTIELRELDQDSAYEIFKLRVAKSQASFVAPNDRSIAEAYFEKHAWFRGIYADGTPVGFVMLLLNPDEPLYYIWRFMIDERHQGKGYGYEAMAEVIKNVRELPGATELLLSYVPGDGSPAPFYERVGFEETGEMDGDERIMRLKL